jgi:hypothetical protein
VSYGQYIDSFSSITMELKVGGICLVQAIEDSAQVKMGVK